MQKAVIDGQKIYLRPVEAGDANQSYCRWMNDPEVTRYTESRFSTHTVESIKCYIEKEMQSGSIFLAIVAKENDKHIGNIKIHRIDKQHKHGEMSLLIGDRDYWGMGVATEAIKLMTDYAFTGLGFHKLYASAYSVNPGSIKAFKKAGFKEEGIMKEQYFCEDGYVDAVLLGLINKVS
jgi:RimJ/RimL family protein N-acetyltransferase